MNKKILITIGILVVVILLLGIYIIHVHKPTVLIEEQLKERFSEFKIQYDEKKAQGYDVTLAEEFARKAKEAFDRKDYKMASKLLDEAFEALKKAKPETIEEKVREKLLNLEREIKAKANELYLTESYLLYKEAKNFYLKGDYKKAEFAVDKAFEALKSADKLDLALSHSHINDRPKFEDELPREYPTRTEWYFMGGNAENEKGNYFSFWFSQTQNMAIVFVGINNETLFDFKKEAEREVEIKDNIIIISSNFQDGFLKMRIYQDKRNLEFFYNGYKIILNTTSRGIPLWHGREKGQMVGFADYMHFGGFDDPVEIKGIIEKDGRIYEFDGYGDYEHSWADLPRTESYESWICVNTPEFYGVFLLTASCDKKTIFGKNGRTGFTLTNESFRADEFEVVDSDYPRIIKLKGKFEEGEFEITMKSYYLQSPGWITKHPYMLVEGKVIKRNSTMRLNGYGFLELARCSFEGAECGNGICESGESGYNCPGDCCVSGDEICPAGCTMQNDDDCSDLGNIHDPSIDELALEELFGIPRHNNWFSFVGKGDDQNLYGLYGNFQYHYGRKASIIVKRFPDDEIICHLSFDWRKESGRRFDGEKIIYWAPSSLALEEDYIKYTIHDDSYELEANCGDTHINLVFQKEVSFWYNKARPAEVYPDCEIAGIEEISKATGHILIKGKRINLTGLGHSEHFFNKGNIVQKIKEYGNEWWMPFRFDEVQGIFVVFGDYKDAGLLIDGEYVIPSSFDYFVDNKKRSIRIVADTPKGTLDITHHIFGNTGAEYLATSTGKLNGRELTNGFGWVEHVR